MTYRFSHLSDRALVEQARGHLAAQRTSTAGLLADLVEIEDRRIFANEGYPSMYAWCMGELGMTDDAVADRIHAARTARRFPAILPMLADGRLHLTAALMLEKYLTDANASTLLEAAAGKSKSAVGEMLAARFPTTESLPLVLASQNASAHSPVPERVASSVLVKVADADAAVAASETQSSTSIVRHVAPPTPQPKIAPVAAGRHLFQFMGDDAQRELLTAVQDLVGTQRAGDLASIFFTGLALFREKLEKQKFAETKRPARRPRPRKKDSRGIPAHVRRAVSERDGHRCTFVGTNGKRCPGKRGLEFDHIVPIARGGDSTAGNVRLLCRTHNQLEAERMFGAGFMAERRPRAR